MFQKKIGNRLKKQREALGMTKTALARAAGISASTIRRIEAGGETTILMLFRIGVILSKGRSIRLWMMNLFDGL